MEQFQTVKIEFLQEALSDKPSFLRDVVLVANEAQRCERAAEEPREQITVLGFVYQMAERIIGARDHIADGGVTETIQGLSGNGHFGR